MENEPEVRRLGWAGVEMKFEGETLVVDLFEERNAFAPFIEEVAGELPAPAGQVDVALVTHLHADHTDPAAIGRSLKPGGKVLRPDPAPGNDLDRASTMMAEQGLAGLDADVEVAELWQTRTVGPFEVTAVPAVDGFGDPQYSWVIEAGEKTFFHGGDTMFHGAWWPIASRFDSIDMAFLPINGADCNFPHRQPKSPYPVCLDPEAAAAAASLLKAKAVVPIHYDGIHQAGIYEQTEDPEGRFLAAARERGFDALVLKPGETLASRV